MFAHCTAAFRKHRHLRAGDTLGQIFGSFSKCSGMFADHDCLRIAPGDSAARAVVQHKLWGLPPVLCCKSLRLMGASFDCRRCSDFMFSIHPHIVVHVLCLALRCANAEIQYNLIFCLMLSMQHYCVPLFVSFTCIFFCFNVHLPGFPVSFCRSYVWNHRDESDHLLRCPYRCLLAPL